MLKILIENKEQYIKMGTSIQMEMNNSIFNTETSILDETRISNVCRYSGNFTPPESIYL